MQSGAPCTGAPVPGAPVVLYQFGFMRFYGKIVLENSVKNPGLRVYSKAGLSPNPSFVFVYKNPGEPAGVRIRGTRLWNPYTLTRVRPSDNHENDGFHINYQPQHRTVRFKSLERSSILLLNGQNQTPNSVPKVRGARGAQPPHL
jgi:hypothetical protein